jgi:hypothetical protein
MIIIKKENLGSNMKFDLKQPKRSHSGASYKKNKNKIEIETERLLGKRVMKMI